MLCGHWRGTYLCSELVLQRLSEDLLADELCYQAAHFGGGALVAAGKEEERREGGNCAASSIREP